MANRSSKETRDMQDKFALYYTTDIECEGNIYKSAIKAGYSEKYANVGGKRLLGIVRIKEKIDEYNNKINKDLKKIFNVNKITKEKILEELFAIGFSRIDDVVNIYESEFYNSDTENIEKTTRVSIKPTKEISKRARKAISQIKETPSGIEIKFYDKLSALEKISKIQGLFIDKIEHSGNIGNKNYADMTDEELRENLLFKYKEGKISKKELEEMDIKI